MIRALGFSDDGPEERRTRDAILKGTETGLARIDEVAASLNTPPRIVEVVRTIYTRRCERLRSNVNAEPNAIVENEDGRAFRALRVQLIEIERDTLVELRNQGGMSEEQLQHLQQDLDLETLQPLR